MGTRSIEVGPAERGTLRAGLSARPGRAPRTARGRPEWIAHSRSSHVRANVAVTHFIALIALLTFQTPALAESATPEPSGSRLETRPNTTRLTIGGLMFGVPYVAGATYALAREKDPRGMKRELLFVPVLGPLLAIRGVGCDDTSDSDDQCSGLAWPWQALAIDAIVQGTGVVLVGSAFWSPDEVVVAEPRQTVRVTIAPGVTGSGAVITIDGAF